MPPLLIKNIRQLVTVAGSTLGVKTGPSMSDLCVIEDGAVYCSDGIIQWIGPTKEFTGTLPEEADVIDADGRIALPGFVDAHTHLLFGGSRENEFAMRASGKSYQEIAAQGGGIMSSVRATRAATKKELKKSAGKRLDDMMQYGTTTAEIKSGYGLDFDSEIKMLEAIHELSREHLMTISSTFLGAHAVPPEFREKREEYIHEVITNMLPYIAKRKLAEFCDVFCESGYYSVAESRIILETAHTLGLKCKLHADEFNALGGTELAAELHAVSVDHLEHISESGIECLKNSNTVAVVLPGVSFFLKNPYAPARKIIDAGIPLAIASDFNPGSCMSFSMPLMMTIACTSMGVSPEEAITAATLHGAAALGLADQVGSIEPGKQADIILYDAPHYNFLAYHFGTNLVTTVIKRGTILEFS
ncbi:MAG: imidazolonepropionase [bacterium]